MERWRFVANVGLESLCSQRLSAYLEPVCAEAAGGAAAICCPVWSGWTIKACTLPLTRHTLTSIHILEPFYKILKKSFRIYSLLIDVDRAYNETRPKSL